MKPQVPTPRGRFEALEHLAPETEPDVFWGLGWGLELNPKAFFHWGANPGATALGLGLPEKREAFVVFMNSDRGPDIVPGIVEHITRGQHPALTWLGL